MVIYPSKEAFNAKLAIMTVREHLCGYFEMKTDCVHASREVDSTTGHTVCLGCNRITVDSGLRVCEACETEYINLNKFQDSGFETYCEKCEVTYGL